MMKSDVSHGLLSTNATLLVYNMSSLQPPLNTGTHLAIS